MQKIKKILALALTSIQILSFVPEAHALPESTENEPQVFEFIVKYKPKEPPENPEDTLVQLMSAEDLNGCEKKETVDSDIGKFELIGGETQEQVDGAMERIQALSFVESVEPNVRIYLDNVEPEPLYGQQWGLENIGQTVQGNAGAAGMDANMEGVWNETKGNPDLVVAVIDTGMDINHEDLKTNIFQNKKEIPGNGIDDDKNGFVDDYNGWDFYHRDNTVYDGQLDSVGKNEDLHGTHVGGMVYQKNNYLQNLFLNY